MTSHSPKIEVLSCPERRRRWWTAEKLSIIQETYEPDATVSIVARRYGHGHDRHLEIIRVEAVQGHR
jgi:transposase